jgi:hypothetical protein
VVRPNPKEKTPGLPVMWAFPTMLRRRWLMKPSPHSIGMWSRCWLIWSGWELVRGRALSDCPLLLGGPCLDAHEPWVRASRRRRHYCECRCSPVASAGPLAAAGCPRTESRARKKSQSITQNLHNDSNS